jgi:tryptophan-rich sensory protein
LRPGRLERALPLVAAAAAATFTAALGGLLTDLGPWYQALRQPGWKPPDWAFGPIWTTIFTFIAASAAIAWNRSPELAGRRLVVALFAGNAVLNVLWSVLFFRLQRPDWALVEVVVLWLSIAAMIATLRRTSALASALLFPYLAWVSCASFLNLAVVQLNGPFPGRP